MGSGPGQCSKYFSEKGFNVTGIDFSEEFVNIARENVSGVNFIEANILSYPFEQEKYNGIWANAVLLHFTTEEVESLLLRIKDALYLNGILYISFMEGSGERLFERIDRGVEDKRYFYDRSINEIIDLVQAAGFKIIETARMEGWPVVFIHCYAQKNQNF